MSSAALETEGLGKYYPRYRRSGAAYVTLRDALAATAGSVFRRDRTDPQTRPASSEGFWALRDVSFSLERGDVLGVVGHNGAGKSTLLKLLSRITPPSAGRAVLHGRAASLLEVGTGFHRELTGRENIFLNGAILGMSRDEIRARFDAIVAFAEVEQFVDTPVKYYSSGMYVRLAFAVASTLDPDVLIVDEVLAVGDAQFQRRCLGRMQEISGSGGRTVIFVSHSMAAVRSLCPRTLWLDRGTPRALGPTGEVIPQYLESALGTGGVLNAEQVSRPRAGHGERLRISRVTLNDGAAVAHAEALRVAIEYVASTSLTDVSFGVGFSSSDGARILTLDSDLEEAPRDIVPSGEARIVVTIPSIPLEPGIYSLDVAARAGDRAGLDYLPGCLIVQVLPGPATSPAALREGGGVRLPAIWEWVAES